MSSKFLYVGTHADTLASGATIDHGAEPIDAAQIDPERQPDKDWLEEGVLIALPDNSLGDIAERSIDSVLEWVGDSETRAHEALAAEKARGDDARKTLIDKLTKEPR